MLSFVIPVFNEAANIARCVVSIRRHVPHDEPYEVLVVDNGSTDESAVLAVAAGARVMSSQARTIAEVRNEGVASSRGDVMVFLDGDCALTADWERGIKAVLAKVRTTQVSAAGSHPIPPPGEDAFLWRYWFVPLFQQPATSHIGTAHLMCRRDVFESMGGFDQRLETDEDFDFCARIKAVGGALFVEQQLTVEHYGFPRTWSGFFKRERWHGRGSASSWRNVLGSKVAILSVLFTLAVLTSIVASLMGASLVATAGLVLAVGVLGSSVIAKFSRAGLVSQGAAFAIFGVYYLAHALAIADALTTHLSRSREEAGVR